MYFNRDKFKKTLVNNKLIKNYTTKYGREKVEYNIKQLKLTERNRNEKIDFEILKNMWDHKKTFE